MPFFVFDSTGFGVLSVIHCDAVMAETHQDTATITEHAVESGSAITDYVRPHNTKLSMECFITNTPVASDVFVAFEVGQLTGVSLPAVLKGAIRRWVSGAQVNGGGSVLPIQTNGFPRPQVPITTVEARSISTPNIVSGPTLQFPRRVDRVKDVYLAIKKCAQEGTEIAFFSDVHDYPKMYISSLSRPRSGEDAMTFSIELSSVRFVSSQTTIVSIKRPEEKRAVAKGAPVDSAVTATDDSDLDVTDGDSTSIALQLQSIAGG